MMTFSANTLRLNRDLRVSPFGNERIVTDLGIETPPLGESLEYTHYRSLFGNFITGPSLPSNIQSFEDEIKHYHARPETPFFQDLQKTHVTDPLIWWKNHQHKYPRFAHSLVVSSASAQKELFYICFYVKPKHGWALQKTKYLFFRA
jgi:hypothetical protein